MFGKSRTNLIAALGAIGLATWCMGADGATPPPQSGFAITSTTFKDGGMLPLRVGFTRESGNANCLGQNISPQLSWSHVPAGTRSYAVTMVTAEVDDINMVVYGIPAELSSLEEGELSKPSSNYVGGKNRFGQGTWRGMCSPAGAAPHHYVIKVIATDLDPKELPPGLTLAELQERLKGHFKDAAVLVGLSVHP